MKQNQESLYQLAKGALVSHFSESSAGSVIVDTEARIVWMNRQYPVLLEISDPAHAIGKAIEEVIPNSLLRQIVETGQPIMLDIMDFKERSFVVSRLPLRNPEGVVVGAVGFVLYDNPRHLAPLFSRYEKLRADLADAERRLADARRTKYTFASFIGAGPSTNEVKQAARRASRTTSSVLILGETGTGKELLAQAIHAASSRAHKPFVAVNIAAIPETLLEAEFFGVAAGAYTGADKRGRDGKFKLADGGTLFFDEIGDMPLALQAKLLRTLQEREVEIVGSNQLLPVDVRIIAATSRDLEQMVADGQFRADLYYRLNVICLRTPSLRERPEDMGLLADYFIEQICSQHDLPFRTISTPALNRLLQHDWPGNIRELSNVLERALLMSDGEVLEVDDIERGMPRASGQIHLPPQATAGGNTPANTGVQPGLADAVARAETKAITAALRDSNGNKSQAARLLGISRAALYEKIAALGIEI